MKIRVLAFCAALACAVPAADAWADARIDFRATEGGGASIQSLSIGQGKLRSDSNASTSVIMDPDTGAMTILQHDKRKYIHMGRAEIEQMSAALNSAMAQLEQSMANLPPAMRAQMQGMMGGARGGAGGQPMVQVVQTDQRETVAGHSCTIHQTRAQGRTVSEACMGSTAVLDGLSAADRRTLDSALAMTTKLAESMFQGPLGNMVDLGPFKAGLFPLRVTDIDGGRRATSEFAGIENGSLSADLFATPPGYREEKIEIPRIGR
jgi:hypothetical protein